jgi:hypothetical protein
MHICEIRMTDISDANVMNVYLVSSLVTNVSMPVPKYLENAESQNATLISKPPYAKITLELHNFCQHVTLWASSVPILP